MQNVIAIDGPSGVGKSSVSKFLAKALGWTYLDTGAMYRAVTLAWLRHGQTDALLTNDTWLQGLDLDFAEGKMLLQGARVGTAIRSPEVTRLVSKVAAVPNVRETLTRLQRQIASRKPCVLDGRDIGTVVFPDAFLKVFLTAAPKVRAQRRWLQLGGHESNMSLEEVLADQLERDRQDSERETAPLVKAEDAWVVETDTLAQDQVVKHILSEAKRRLALHSE